jgi:hypothetical protein
MKIGENNFLELNISRKKIDKMDFCTFQQFSFYVKG